MFVYVCVCVCACACLMCQSVCLCEYSRCVCECQAGSSSFFLLQRVYVTCADGFIMQFSWSVPRLGYCCSLRLSLVIDSTIGRQQFSLYYTLQTRTFGAWCFGHRLSVFRFRTVLQGMFAIHAHGTRR